MERRTKGTGSITPVEGYKDKWRIRWQVSLKPRKWGSATIRGSKRKAEELLRQKQQQFEKGYVPKSKETVGEYLQEWLDGYGNNKLEPKTLQVYRQYIANYITPENISDIELQKLDPSHLQRIYAQMQGRGLSPITIHHLHRILHRACVVAIGQDKLPAHKNPCAKERVFLPKINKKKVKPWPEDTLRKFFDIAKDNKFRDVYHLAVLTGLRRGEICALQWSSVDIDRKGISVVASLEKLTGTQPRLKIPKSGTSDRVISISEEVVELLRKVQSQQITTKAVLGNEWNSDGWVFCTPKGGPIVPDRLTQDFGAIVKGHGLPDMTLHGLRHQFASLLLKKGVDLKVTQELMGHANVSITADTYSHLLPGAQQEAVSRLNGIVSLN